MDSLRFRRTIITKPAANLNSVRFLVIEGCNGVGKSTIARELSLRLGAACFHYPPEFYRFRQEVELDLRVAPMPRLLYYLAATLHLADLIRAELACRPVICDRYMASPLSLLIAGAILAEEEVCRIIQPFEPYLCVADLTLLLRADHAVAQDRIRSRLGDRTVMTPTERQVLESAEFFCRREAALRRQAQRLGPMIELDTTELELADMGAAAWEAICSHKL
jgi:thymidylate kinase